jgi:hypothetical protein
VFNVSTTKSRTIRLVSVANTTPNTGKTKMAINTTVKVFADLPNKPVALNTKHRFSIPKEIKHTADTVMIRRVRFHDGTSYVKMDTNKCNVNTATGSDEDIDKFIEYVLRECFYLTPEGSYINN